jgi:hypothetical protein
MEGGCSTDGPRGITTKCNSCGQIPFLRCECQPGYMYYSPPYFLVQGVPIVEAWAHGRLGQVKCELVIM